jgi:hypothetical protein
MADYIPVDNNFAKFAQTPKILTGVVKVAATGLTTNTPANLVQLGVVGAKGGLAVGGYCMPLGTCTAASILLYASTDNGATKFPIDSVLQVSFGTQATAKRLKTNFTEITRDMPLPLPAGAIIYGATEVQIADGVQVGAYIFEF